MRTGINLVAISALGLSVFGFGCGDDGTGGSGATGGSEGGSGATGGTPTTGGTGGGTGGTEPQLLANGSNCGTNGECESGFCFTEDLSAWAQGYCTDACNSLVTCQVGSECITVAQDGTALCLQTCTLGGTDCKGVGQECVDAGGDPPTAVCVGGCNMDSQCATSCDNDSGICGVAEVCNNDMDDDEDGLNNCEELDCSADAGCMGTIATACTGATAIVLGTPVNGTTAEMDASNFSASCSGPGAGEKTYSLTAPSAGFLFVTLDSPTADMGVYARSACADATTEVACVDAKVAGGQEVLIREVAAAEALTLFVDGFEAGEFGAYTLNAAVVPGQPETEMNGTVATANAITLTNGIALVPAKIDPTADEDWYSVTVPANTTLTLEIMSFGASTCGGDIDSNIELFQADGTTLIGENDDISPFGNFCSLFTTAAPLAAGTYMVRVTKSSFDMGMLTFEYLLRFGATST